MATMTNLGGWFPDEVTTYFYGTGLGDERMQQGVAVIAAAKDDARRLGETMYVYTEENDDEIIAVDPDGTVRRNVTDAEYAR